MEDETGRDGRVVVAVTDAGFAATVTIDPPEGEGKWPTLRDAQLALKEAGVTYGVRRELLGMVVRQGSGDEPVVVAEGRRPVPGVDGQVKYGFNVETELRPAEREDGTVDYYELGAVQSVTQGQVLAIRVPPVAGTPGVNVYGEVVSAPEGGDVRLLPGRNVALEEDGNRLISLGEGQPVLEKDGRVSVYPLYRVNGNVDFSVGNVNFIGSVEVAGDVGPGFSVRAQGDIIVRGSSSGELLEAGQDVLVNGGIQGQGRGRVRAGRDVRARFVENASVDCQRQLVSGSVLHSQVNCAGRVEAASGKGLIVGGSVRAFEAVVARTIGSPLATPTEIRVGSDPAARAELERLGAELNEVRRNVTSVKSQLFTVQSLVRGGDRSQELQARRVRLVRSLRLLSERQAELEDRLEALESATHSNSQALLVAEVVHPGVTLTVGVETVFVDETRHRVRMRGGAGARDGR